MVSTDKGPVLNASSSRFSNSSTVGCVAIEVVTGLYAEIAGHAASVFTTRAVASMPQQQRPSALTTQGAVANYVTQ